MMSHRRVWTFRWLAGLFVAGGFMCTLEAQQQSTGCTGAAPRPRQQVLLFLSQRQPENGGTRAR